MPPSATDAYSALQNFNSTRSAPTDYLNKANQQFNVQGLQGENQNLQGAVTNLQNSVAAVNPSVTGRTSGTFTTEGQRQALVNREQQPILTNLGSQQQAYGQSQNALGTAQTNANQMAQSLYNSDQQKYQGLLDQYNAANAADQFAKQQQAAAASLAEQQRQYNASLAEQQRQFNLTPHSSGGGGGNISLGGLGLGGQTQAASAGPHMTQKQGDSGFAFTSTGGQAISAAQYAQQANIPLGSLLQQMAKSGDTYAGQAYNWLKAQQAMPYAKSNPNQVLKNAASKFGSIFWGS